MKLPIFLTLAALCAASGIANAQENPSVQSQSKGVEFEPPQWKGELPSSLDKLPLNVQLTFDPKLPPYPRLNSAMAAGTKIRVLQTYRGPIIQAEVVRQSAGDVLRAATAMMGIRAVIDPELDKRRSAVEVVRVAQWEDLLRFGGAEFWKSASGTYFFAAIPYITVQTQNQESDKVAEKYRLEREKMLADPRFDPFVMPRGGLDPKDRFGRPIEPQPDWETREFNGHEFYHIPLPKAVE